MGLNGWGTHQNVIAKEGDAGPRAPWVRHISWDGVSPQQPQGSNGRSRALGVGPV